MMNRWLAVEFLQALLASTLLARVLLQPFPSIRRVLVFTLLPTIVTPFVLSLHGVATDYRVRWLELRMLDWVCLTVVTYSLLTGLFRRLPGVLKLFRTGLTFTFIGSSSAAIFEKGYFAPRFETVVSESIQFDRMMLATVGVIMLLITGFVGWCRVPVSKNLATVSSGIAIYSGGRAIPALTSGPILWNSGIRLDIILTIVWITLLTYWTLFLSSRDEIRNGFEANR